MQPFCCRYKLIDVSKPREVATKSAEGRTCARLCHQAGELEQIQFLLGHVSIHTTDGHLGCKQRFQNAVNDHIGRGPDARL